VYTVQNFKTKKELKNAVEAYLAGNGKPVRVYQPGPFGGNEPSNGTVYLEGPHAPEPHRWYAQGTLANGVLVKVK
jgi:hypothetical protein